MMMAGSVREPTAVVTDFLQYAGRILLAFAVHDKGIPLYVCCESFKRRKEAMGELGTPRLPGMRVRNIYFDITPAKLIDRWIDETGVHATGILSEETHRRPASDRTISH